MRKHYYEYRHVVGFDETDLIGNVHRVDYERGQGRCREMFLLEHAPAILDELCEDLQLPVVDSKTEYLSELAAFDEVSIRMRVGEVTATWIVLAFDHVRLREGAEELVARGRQRVACRRVVNGDAVPAPLPPQLETALKAYLIVPVSSSMVTGTGGRA